MKWFFMLLMTLGFGVQAQVNTAVLPFDMTPLHFEPINDADEFYSVGLGYQIRLNNKQVTFDFAEETQAMTIGFINTGEAGQIYGFDELPGRSHYLSGNNTDNWRRDVPNYAQVGVDEIYPGVDLVFYGNQGELEFDFVVNPLIRVDTIKLKYQGADSMHVDEHGNLIINKKQRQIIQKKPFAYQLRDGVKQPIYVAYHLVDNQLGFTVGSYDRRQPLIIDPVISYSSYLGGDYYDSATAVATDVNGNIYIAGKTESYNFPTTTGAYQENRLAAPGTNDIFITKIDGATNSIVYSTYLSGNGIDVAIGIEADSEGNTYVSGYTTSSNFPGADSITYQSNGDAFVTKLSPDGSSINYSVYFGGSNVDETSAMTIDSNGVVSITGFTKSDDLPLINSLQNALADTLYGDAFVAQFDASGNVILSSYLGGTEHEEFNDIVVDNQGGIYLAGCTNSDDFPSTIGAYQTTAAGNDDVIVAKINTGNPSALSYATFIAGSYNECTYGLAVNATGEVFVTGKAEIGFPTVNAYQANNAGGTDVFVSKLSAAGDNLLYSTYLGSFSRDSGHAIELDADGSIIIAGHTESSIFPRMGPFQVNLGGGVDGFVSKLSSDGSTLKFSSFIGGQGDETLSALSLDPNGDLVIAGFTASTDYPVTGDALQSALETGVYTDVFVSRISNVDASTDLSVEIITAATTYAVDDDLLFTIAVTNNGPDTATGVNVVFDLPANTSYQSMSANFLCQVSGDTYTCTGGIIETGATESITFYLTAATAGDAVLNVSMSNEAEGDTNAANNTASATVSITDDSSATGGTDNPPADDTSTPDNTTAPTTNDASGGGVLNMMFILLMLMLFNIRRKYV